MRLNALFARVLQVSFTSRERRRERENGEIPAESNNTSPTAQSNNNTPIPPHREREREAHIEREREAHSAAERERREVTAEWKKRIAPQLLLQLLPATCQSFHFHKMQTSRRNTAGVCMKV